MSANYKLPDYSVYFDTNVAYSKKPSDPISSKLVTSIEKARAIARIEVRVPEVVLKELAYQQFVIAQAATENLKKNCQTLSEVCGLADLRAPEETVLKAAVEEQLAKSVEKASFSIIPTPIAKIDWAGVVHDSCWRNAPFEKPKSEDDLAEKGFRDKVILETIKDDAGKIHQGVIAFISGDNLLRAAFKDQAASKCPIEVYSHFDELLGHLDLLAQTQSSAFTNAVLSKVASVFYTPGDPNCFAISQGIVGKLVDEYSDEMSRPPLLSLGPPKYPETANRFSALIQPITGGFGNYFEEFNRWTPVTSVKLFASPPVFQGDKKDGRYHWLSSITLARLLRKTESRTGQYFPEERIRTKDIDVKWNCKIDPITAEFSDPSVESLTPTLRESFLEASTHSRSAYKMPLWPGYAEQES